jgi:hypothetical protein
MGSVVSRQRSEEIHLRLSTEEVGLLTKLVDRLGLSRVQVIRLLIRQAAEK